MTYPTHMSMAEVIKSYGLPKSHKIHWSKTRKADVVRAVHDRAISFNEARDRYLLSRSEFEQWERDCGVAHIDTSEKSVRLEGV